MKVAIIGHKQIDITPTLTENLYAYLNQSIINKKVDIFLFGSNSQFNDLCYKIVSNLKEKFSHVKRVYVRAEYENIHDDYKNYLLSMYEETFFPIEAHNAGYRAYIKRNQVMIDMCDEVLTYYNPNGLSPHSSSGTHIAMKYATQKKRSIYNI